MTDDVTGSFEVVRIPGHSTAWHSNLPQVLLEDSLLSTKKEYTNKHMQLTANTMLSGSRRHS
jgi:hypothetical protein